MKGGYSDSDSSRTVTYVNRVVPDSTPVPVDQGSSTGYSNADSSRSVTYVNRRVIPDEVEVNQGSSTLPSVSLNFNGAHTLAGEAVLHHVMYNANGVPVVTTISGNALNGGSLNGGAVNGALVNTGLGNGGLLNGDLVNGGLVNGGHYHRGYTQLLHLHNHGGRPLNGGGMVLPATVGADIFTQLLTPNGMSDNGPGERASMRAG